MAVDLWKRLSRDNCSNIIISFLLRCVITTLSFVGWKRRYRHFSTFFFLLEMETYSSENAKEGLLGFLWLFFFQTEATPI